MAKVKENEEIYRLRNEGKTFTEIANLFGISPQACGERFRRWERNRLRVKYRSVPALREG